VRQGSSAVEQRTHKPLVGGSSPPPGTPLRETVVISSARVPFRKSFTPSRTLVRSGIKIFLSRPYHLELTTVSLKGVGQLFSRTPAYYLKIGAFFAVLDQNLFGFGRHFFCTKCLKMPSDIAFLLKVRKLLLFWNRKVSENIYYCKILEFIL
jgi:hypothetical protein